MDESTGILPGLPAVGGKPVHVGFDGGRLTSDAGILLPAAQLPLGYLVATRRASQLLASGNFRIMLRPTRRGEEGENMHFDLAAIPPTDAYRLLVSTVVPRPIALATTVDAKGRVNAAPFSFFNAVSSIPPVVVLGISPGDPNSEIGDGYKDTERNIRDTGEFVVNLVDEALAERMNICAVDFPTAGGELDRAEPHAVPSIGVRPPRIAESPVSFECRRITGLSLGARSTLEVGRVIHIHIRDALVDAERRYVATEKMRLIGRMHGRGWYARTSDLFLMERLNLAEWRDGKR